MMQRRPSNERFRMYRQTKNSYAMYGLLVILAVITGLTAGFAFILPAVSGVITVVGIVTGLLVTFFVFAMGGRR